MCTHPKKQRASTDFKARWKECNLAKVMLRHSTLFKSFLVNFISKWLPFQQLDYAGTYVISCMYCCCSQLECWCWAPSLSKPLPSFQNEVHNSLGSMLIHTLYSKIRQPFNIAHVHFVIFRTYSSFCLFAAEKVRLWEVDTLYSEGRIGESPSGTAQAFAGKRCSSTPRNAMLQTRLQRRQSCGMISVYCLTLTFVNVIACEWTHLNTVLH